MFRGLYRYVQGILGWVWDGIEDIGCYLAWHCMVLEWMVVGGHAWLRFSDNAAEYRVINTLEYILIGSKLILFASGRYHIRADSSYLSVIQAILRCRYLCDI